MTTKELRQELIKALPTDAIFDVFVMDFFPQVYKSFSRGMSRTEKETYLISAIEPDILEERISEFRASSNYHLMPLFKIHPGGKHQAKKNLSKSFSWKNIRRIIYADAVLNIASSMLEWVAEKLGIRNREFEHFRNFRPLFIIVLLIIIFITIIRRCG